MGEERQGTRHGLVDDLAIGEDDGLIRALGDGGVVGDDQDGLALGSQFLEEVEDIIRRT